MPRKRKTERSNCKFCCRPVRIKGRFADGDPRYGNTCKSCHKYGVVKTKCEFCGFVPMHPCQLDVDHIDGNHKNSSRDNLQVLCANCHRLKTFVNGDNK